MACTCSRRKRSYSICSPSYHLHHQTWAMLILAATSEIALPIALPMESVLVGVHSHANSSPFCIMSAFCTLEMPAIVGSLRLRGGNGRSNSALRLRDESDDEVKDDEDIGLSIDLRKLHAYKESFRQYRPAKGHEGGPLDHIIGRQRSVKDTVSKDEATQDGQGDDDWESDVKAPDIDKIEARKDDNGVSQDLSVGRLCVHNPHLA